MKLLAKISKSIAFKNATIDKEDMTITEIIKDDTNVYNLDNLLNEWDGIQGISLVIKKDDEIPNDEITE